jgi:hypothetical protein
VRDHVRIEEQLAARALGGLEAPEAEELARAMAEHGDDCPECKRLEAEYEDVGGRLAFSLAPAGVPEGMEERILEGSPREAAQGRMSRFRRALAATAAALLVLAGGVGGYLVAPRPAPELQAVASYLSEPGTRITTLDGNAPGNLALAFGPGRDVSYLIGANLRPPPRGKVYELWLRRGGRLQPAAIFSAEGNVIVVPVPSDPSTATEAAVTLEDAPGADAPSTHPIFKASLGA